MKDNHRTSVKGLNKEPLARELGAVHYIDTCTMDPADELQRLGGARVILATDRDGKGISSLVGGLGHNGQVLIVAAPGDPITLNAVMRITPRTSIQGEPSGTAKERGYFAVRRAGRSSSDDRAVSTA